MVIRPGLPVVVGCWLGEDGQRFPSDSNVTRTVRQAMNASPVLAALIVALAGVVLVSLQRVGWRGARGWLVAWATPLVILGLAAAGLTFLWHHIQALSEGAQQPAKSELGYVRTFAEILGIAAGALFLLVKLAAGYGFSNAKLSTATSRSPLDNESDLLVVTTTIASGAARSFQLLDVAMVALEATSGLPATPLRVSGFRKSAAIGSQLGRGEVAAPLTLNPGDSIEVVGWVTVSRGAVVPVRISALSLASTALTTEQWTSAVVSAPREAGEHSARV